MKIIYVFLHIQCEEQFKEKLFFDENVLYELLSEIIFKKLKKIFIFFIKNYCFNKKNIFLFLIKNFCFNKKNFLIKSF